MSAKRFLVIILLLGVYTVALLAKNNNNVVFNRNTVGVTFIPYPKLVEGGVVPKWTDYTLQEVKTMYEVVLDKFSMTATFTTGPTDVKYVYNSTYHKDCAKAVLSAEAASLVNKERNTLATTVLIGVWRREDSAQRMKTEVELAFECAEIANRNFRGTATGIIFTSIDIGKSLPRARQTLDLITENKARANGQGLKVGTRQDCAALYSTDDDDSKQLAETFRKIIIQSDFIICKIFYPYIVGGVDILINDVKEKGPQYKAAIKEINPNIHVMVEAGWPSDGKVGGESVSNLVKLWRTLNEWSEQVNITTWLFQAFDEPYKIFTTLSPHYGWWILKRNQDAGRKEGYVEKIIENSKVEDGETETNIGGYIGAAIGLGAFCTLVCFGYFLYFRVSKLKEILSKEDIQEFVHGISQESASALTGEYGEVESALTIPYNKEKFELEKAKIDIKHDILLGSGQAGCVYKAFVETETGVMTEVALKMAKPGCSKNTLKSMLSEIKILAYLDKHPNIVSIVGAYTAEIGKGIVYIATEICKLGSLEAILRKEQETYPKRSTVSTYENMPSSIENNGTALYTNQRSITLTDMLKWAHEIACGMEYLATKNVIHADLATRNVLLTCEKTAKITDFGLSRRLYEYTNYVKQQQEPLPWRWMAIESLKNMHFSPKSDVWSYGVTLWEIFSLGDVPYPGLAWNVEFVNSLEGGLRMISPTYSPPEMFQVMSDCWKENPNERPTFAALKLITGELVANIQENSNSNNLTL